MLKETSKIRKERLLCRFPCHRHLYPWQMCKDKFLFINLAILCRWIGFLFVGLSLRCNRLKYNPFPLQFFLEILIWTYSLVSGVDVSLLRFTCEVYLFLHCTEPRGDNLIKASSSLNIEIPFLIPKNIVSAPKWDEWVVERSEKIKDKD